MSRYWNFNSGREDKVKEKELFNEGFNYPISDVCELLSVSRSWVVHTLLKEIDYVVYAPNFIYNYNHSYSLTYIKKTDLGKWIIKNADYIVQTEFVDLSHFLDSYSDIYNEALHLYKEIKNKLETSEIRLKKGIVPQKVLEFINSKLKAYNMEQNCKSQKRGRYLWKKVEPFDIFNPNVKHYTVKEYERKGISRELIYRRAFENGDIKIKISSQICLYVKNPQNIKNYKMPFLIPYGKTIYINGRKK